ncbi:MAG: hypothetical protein JWP80_614 [Pseudomonas sp.]|nr:hypothetical protein [Pseudomonas sp.]
MSQPSKHPKPAQTKDTVGDVGAANKRLNQQGEQPRHPAPPDSRDRSST